MAATSIQVDRWRSTDSPSNGSADRRWRRGLGWRGTDLADERLEAPILAQAVEIRFDVQTDQVGAAVLEAFLEQGDRHIFLIGLCVAARGGFEQVALSVGFAAVAKERFEPRAFERAGDLLGLCLLDHRLAERDGFLDEAFVPEGALEPEEGHAEAAIELERGS